MVIFMYSIDDLNNINTELLPLKAIAERERKSIYGLTGKIYTPHIDVCTQVSIKKAQILLYLKKKGDIAFSDVELISEKLDISHNRAKNHAVVEHEGVNYERRFSPLKLSKSGKIVRKWAKYWLRHENNGEVDRQWENNVKEIWPEYFCINVYDL